MKVAVVTGASRGIGKKTAELLAQEGYRVYDISRSGEDEGDILHITADITDEEAVKEAFSRIAARESKIDVLVLNAGFGISGAAEFTKTEDAQRQFDVNFFGMFRCVKYAMPLVREARGRIIAVSSAAAVFPIPFQAFYSASKSAVRTFMTALRNEVAMFGVSVCVVMPGDVCTHFTAAREKSESGEDIYGGRIGASVAVMERDEKNGMQPEKIAAAIGKIVRKRYVRPIYTPGAGYKLFGVLERILGPTLVSFILRIMYVKKK